MTNQSLSMTYESFCDYCEQVASEIPGTYIPLYDFVTRDNYEEYERASAWWPTDAPTPVALPSLQNIARIRRGDSQIPAQTFKQVLDAATSRCVAWLEAEGRYVPNPNETPAQRKARKNREAQQRFRANHGSPNKPAPRFDPEKQQRIDVEIEVLATLTRERDAALADLDSKVTAAQAAFLQLCAERTAERARWQRLVAEQRELVSKTKRS